ncbi:MAG: septum site-determining protein MinC [Syntrophothermus sp.]
MPRELVVFKGSRQGLKMLLDPVADFSAVAGELQRKLAHSDGFFAGASVRISTGGRELTPEQMRELVEIIKEEFGLKLSAIEQGSEDPAWETSENEAQANGVAARLVDQSGFDSRMVDRSTLMVKRTLRSGQSVRYNGNVVVLGDVNPGSEIIASGDIIVMGSLRGVAHAGATGDRQAMVAAFRLLPTQLRIAHFIARAPDEKQPLPNVPEIARIKDDLVVVEEYVS